MILVIHQIKGPPIIIYFFFYGITLICVSVVNVYTKYTTTFPVLYTYHIACMNSQVAMHSKHTTSTLTLEVTASTLRLGSSLIIGLRLLN